MENATWKDALFHYPESVGWIVQRFGPLPEGPIRQEDYERFKAAYEAAMGLGADVD